MIHFVRVYLLTQAEMLLLVEVIEISSQMFRIRKEEKSQYLNLTLTKCFTPNLTTYAGLAFILSTLLLRNVKPNKDTSIR